MIPAIFYELNPIVQALLGGLFTWGVTALGASLVFFTKKINYPLLDSMMGFAAGVMIAASVWSLIIPSIDMAEAQGIIPWLPAVIGFLGGGIFLRICDQYLPHLHLGLERSEAEGVPTKWRRSTLLVLAITLHNIPEGLAVGVLFGAAASGMGNIGPSLGQFGPTDTYLSLPLAGKFIMMFCRILGRLEIFAVLVLFTKTYWRT